MLSGITHGTCLNSKEAVLACSSPLCSSPSLMCSSPSCSCHSLHSQCPSPLNFTTMLKQIHNKKLQNTPHFSSLLSWYTQISQTILSYRQELISQTETILQHSLTPEQHQLLKLLSSQSSLNILPPLISQISSSITTTNHQQKFQKQIQEIQTFASKMILSALSLIPKTLLTGVTKPLIIKTLNENTFEIAVSMDEEVGFLKRLIFVEQGYRVKQQKLIFGGLQMYDENPLYTYNLKGGETIYCLLNLYGE